MANQELDASVINPSREVEESDVNLKEEMYKLRQQMSVMYQAWVKKHPPPLYPANPAFVPPLAQSQEPPATDSCRGFKMPKFDLYDGHGDPMAHLRGFCSKMRGAGGKDELLMAYFSQSLSGSALEWYTRQDHRRWYTWDDLAQAFACHFQYNLEIIPDRLSLTKIEKKHNECFREYGFRWREQATRVDPPMKESEMVDYFLQALEPTYYGYLVSAIGKSFNEVVKMAGMVEEGLKSNKIMSYSAIKATTQAIQSGTGGVIGKKKKEDVAKTIGHAEADRVKIAKSSPKNLDYSVSCEFSSGAPGHDTEKCWHLKNAIQELIDANRIEVQAPKRQISTRTCCRPIRRQI
ncbi:PREDICTED: uncharacterized protein LOC109219564 [Nicotiana attenuata]|uniref:uncharacterized protein LOC109219564 n=1 Tax=Nicotiana attenuata TaxID=49451 RepID=UPI000904E29A|nr:PREDICTED: uncharacterized protein LOC109219564 [Nicotiana attenuata]